MDSPFLNKSNSNLLIYFYFYFPSSFQGKEAPSHRRCCVGAGHGRAPSWAAAGPLAMGWRGAVRRVTVADLGFSEDYDQILIARSRKLQPLRIFLNLLLLIHQFSAGVFVFTSFFFQISLILGFPNLSNFKNKVLMFQQSIFKVLLSNK